MKLNYTMLSIGFGFASIGEAAAISSSVPKWPSALKKWDGRTLITGMRLQASYDLPQARLRAEDIKVQGYNKPRRAG